MPLDSTQIKLQELERAEIFKAGTPLTDGVACTFTAQWGREGGDARTPTIIDAGSGWRTRFIQQLCSTQPMRLRVDDQANTRVETGTPNAQVCLRSSSDQVPGILYASELWRRAWLVALTGLGLGHW